MADKEKTRPQLLRELHEARVRLAAYEAGLIGPANPVTTQEVDAGTAQALLRSSPAAIIVLDPEGRVLLWSPMAERVFGWREEEVLGKPNPIVPNDAVAEFNEMLARELGGANSANVTCTRRCRDGSTIEVSLSTAPMHNERGETIGVIGLLTPIEEGEAPPAPASSGELHQLLNTVYDGVWMADENGIVTFVNERMAQMLGYTPDQMIGRRAAEFLHEDVAYTVPENLKRREAGIAETYEIWMPHKESGGSWLQVSAAPIQDRAGQFAGSIATVTDITARKQMEQTLEQRVQARTAELSEANRRLQEQVAAREQAEQALRESEARFRLLAENATDLICRHALTGEYLYVSPSAKKLLGYEPEELIGRSPYELFHPDDIERIEASHERILQWPEASTIEYRLRRSDGGYVWLETIAKAVRDPDTGELAEIHTTSRDATARHEAEEQIRLIKSAVEQIDEMVLITDADLNFPGPRIEYVNAAFCETTGFSWDEVIGKTPRILAGRRTSRDVLNRLRENLSRGETFQGETYNYRKDGSEFILEWHINPLRDDTGRTTHWVAIQRDVTEQRRNEALARQRQNELAHVGRLSTMGEMASGLAHELNQPLAAIAIYVQGCLRRLNHRGMTQDELVDALKNVKDQSQRASEIIRRLRDFVRKREPQRNTANVNHLVREVLALMEPEVQRTLVNLHLQLDETLPAVLVDAVQVEQVVLNLLRNAIEAMEENDPSDRPLTVSTARHGEHHVCIAVQDAGCGMSDEQLDRIYEPFFTTKQSGMGMGLNISQSIAQANDGRLWAERNAGRGVTFSLALPVEGEKPVG